MMSGARRGSGGDRFSWSALENVTGSIIPYVPRGTYPSRETDLPVIATRPTSPSPAVPPSLKLSFFREEEHALPLVPVISFSDSPPGFSPGPSSALSPPVPAPRGHGPSRGCVHPGTPAYTLFTHSPAAFTRQRLLPFRPALGKPYERATFRQWAVSSVLLPATPRRDSQ